MTNSQTTTKRIALLAATLASFLTPFMGSSVNIALPSIGREFGMNAVLLGWVATSYLLSAAMFLVPIGKLADIYGRKRIFVYGISIYTGFSLLCGLATSAAALVASRVLQGVGSAMIFGTGVAILTSVFPVRERGKALGVNVASVYLGLSLGPVLGGFLTQHFGWRSVFIINVPLGTLIIVLVLLKLRGEWAEAKGERFDYVGSAIYSLALVAVMYGFSVLPSALGAWLLVIGLAGILVFAAWEARVSTPVLEIRLLRKNTVFAMSNLAALINYSATFAVGFLLSLYLQHVKALSPQNAGLILVSQPIVMTVLSPFAGMLSDRIEPRIVASMGMAVTFVGLVMLSRLEGDTAPMFIVETLLVLGLGFALFSSPNTNAVMSSVENRYYGVASATLATMRLTGQMLSMGIVMFVLAITIGKLQIHPEYFPLFMKGTKIAFEISAGLCFGGIFVSLARGKVR